MFTIVVDLKKKRLTSGICFNFRFFHCRLNFLNVKKAKKPQIRIEAPPSSFLVFL